MGPRVHLSTPNSSNAPAAAAFKLPLSLAVGGRGSFHRHSNCLPRLSLPGSCAEATGTVVAEQATPQAHTASPAQTGRGRPPGGSYNLPDNVAEGRRHGGHVVGGMTARATLVFAVLALAPGDGSEPADCAGRPCDWSTLSSTDAPRSSSAAARRSLIHASSIVGRTHRGNHDAMPHVSVMRSLSRRRRPVARGRSPRNY